MTSVFLNYTSKGIRYLAILLLVGCAKAQYFEPIELRTEKINIENSNYNASSIQSPWMSLPQINVLQAKIKASTIATRSIDLSRSLNVSVISNSGAVPNNEDRLEGYTDASVVAEKPLYDGDKIALRTKISKVETQSLIIDLERTLNNITADITEQQLTISLSIEAKQIIDTLLLDYEESKPMLETLVSAGVVQKLEYLDLEQKIQGIIASRDAFDTKQKQAEMLLQTKYAKIKLPPTPSFENIIDIKLENLDGLQLKELKLNKQRLQLNRQLKKADKSWGVSFASTATVRTNENSPQLFSGLKLSLPVYDGGAVDAALTSIDEELNALTAEIEAYQITRKTVQSTWSNNVQAYTRALEINKSQIDLINESQIDLDRQLGAGRVKLDQVVSNKLTLLGLKLKKIDLKQELIAQALVATGFFEAGCRLNEMCAEINSFINSL